MNKSFSAKKKKVRTRKMPSEIFFPLSVYIWLEADRFRVTSQRDGGIGFLVLRFWPFLDRFFGFCTQKLRFFGFVVHCGWRIFRFLTFGFRFPRKYWRVFRFDIRYGFRFFPIWPIWVPISLRSERQLRASTDLEYPLKANVMERNAWQTNWNIAGIPR